MMTYNIQKVRNEDMFHIQCARTGIKLGKVTSKWIEKAKMSGNFRFEKA